MIRPLRPTVCILLVVAALSGCSSVSEVTITPLEGAVEKGTSTRLQARVTGEGNPDTTVRWTILDPVAPGTSIAADGVLSIAANEPASTLLLSAVSAQDRSHADTIRIEISANKTRFWRRWLSVRDGLRRTLILSVDTSQFLTADGFTYWQENLSWVPIRNEDPATKAEFTDGFLISGTFRSRTRFSRYDGTIVSSGALVSHRLLISRDGQRIIRSEPGDKEWIVWTRQAE